MRNILYFALFLVVMYSLVTLAGNHRNREEAIVLERKEADIQSLLDLSNKTRERASEFFGASGQFELHNYGKPQLLKKDNQMYGPEIVELTWADHTGDIHHSTIPSDYFRITPRETGSPTVKFHFVGLQPLYTEKQIREEINTIIQAQDLCGFQSGYLSGLKDLRQKIVERNETWRNVMVTPGAYISDPEFMDMCTIYASTSNLIKHGYATK